MKNRELSAEDAAKILGIRKATLYSYVSRGFIRSHEAKGKDRRRTYNAADVQALREKKEKRRYPERAAATALHFGDPVLDSSITLIDGGRLYYRDLDAIVLAEQESFERVAQLLWTGELGSGREFGSAVLSASLQQRYREIADRLEGLTPIERFQVLLPYVAANDVAAYNISAEGIQQTGARILSLMLLAVSDESQGNNPQFYNSQRRLAGSISKQLQKAWLPDRPEAAKAIDAALILCADHELNVSSFTARCVASAESTPYNAILAGLAALRGIRHGGCVESVELFLHEAQADPAAAIGGRLRRGDRIPGFGHLLYQGDDPRCTHLLSLAGAVQNPAFDVTLAGETASEAYAAVGLRPTLDFGLVTLAFCLGLPSGAALTLFAIGRTAGWIAHIIEQVTSRRMIRPRARYVR